MYFCLWAMMHNLRCTSYFNRDDYFSIVHWCNTSLQAQCLHNIELWCVPHQVHPPLTNQVQHPLPPWTTTPSPLKHEVQPPPSLVPLCITHVLPFLPEPPCVYYIHTNTSTSDDDVCQFKDICVNSEDHRVRSYDRRIQRVSRSGRGGVYLLNWTVISQVLYFCNLSCCNYSNYPRVSTYRTSDKRSQD